MNIYERLINQQSKLSVIGLGYVGLPIALEFARKIGTVGFDINPERIELMKKGFDPSEELPPEAFQDCNILFTSDPDDLKQCFFHIVTVSHKPYLDLDEPFFKSVTTDRGILIDVKGLYRKKIKEMIYCFL